MICIVNLVAVGLEEAKTEVERFIFFDNQQVTKQPTRRQFNNEVRQTYDNADN